MCHCHLKRVCCAFLQGGYCTCINFCQRPVLTSGAFRSWKQRKFFMHMQSHINPPLSNILRFLIYILFPSGSFSLLATLPAASTEEEATAAAAAAAAIAATTATV